MKILRAIGGVFVKIWRWIKNTAWVQPLLIVGAIFGVIFSIPAITSAIQGMISGANSADAFYTSFKVSMQGGETSEADKLFNNYNEYDSKYEKDPTFIPVKERKFFLMFTSTGNDATKDIKAGFEVLRNNWGSTFKPIDGTDFNLYTIYTDETTDETTKYETAFSQFLSRQNSFFEQAGSVGLDSNYYINGKITEADLTNLITPGPDNFKIPTIILVDWVHDAKVYEHEEDKPAGISQVMFDVPGADSYERAKLLYQCWNNKGDFSGNPTK
ncbi:MAG: hypothetical protein MJ208_02590 [Bacilli bacterium]|nr:hypothetical protein [Bacilli bacterium]